MMQSTLSLTAMPSGALLNGFDEKQYTIYNNMLHY
jgi:hypothetical protein